MLCTAVKVLLVHHPEIGAVVLEFLGDLRVAMAGVLFALSSRGGSVSFSGAAATVGATIVVLVHDQRDVIVVHVL